MSQILSQRAVAPMDDARRVTFPSPAGTVFGLWTPAPSPAAVAAIAHGAGAGMQHPFLTGVAAGLAGGGVSVLRFNFPYMDAGRRMPDRPPVLLGAWRAAIEELGRRGAGLPMVIGGKSMGGRFASMLASEDSAQCPASALVVFGYPLHPAGHPDLTRDAHLPRIRVPMLFLQGTRDALADASAMEALVRRLGSPARLHVVDGADHSFRVRGVKRPDREVGCELGEVAARFIREVLAPGMTRR